MLGCYVYVRMSKVSFVKLGKAVSFIFFAKGVSFTLG